MKNYSNDLVHAFLVFAEEKNMVKASKRLNLSQPALSRQLMSFERQIGQKIFQTIGRQKRLSLLGQELFTRISSEWRNYDVLINDVATQFQNQPYNPIKIYGPYEWLSRFALEFNNQFTVELKPISGEFVEEEVQKNILSIGVTRFLNENSGLISKKLFENEFYVVFSKNLKIKSKNFNYKLLQELSEHPRFAFRKNSDSETLTKMKEKLNLEPRLIFPNWQILLKTVENGKGWVIAPSDVVLNFNHQKIEMIKVPTSIIPISTFHLIYKPEYSKIVWFKKLISEIQLYESQK